MGWIVGESGFILWGGLLERVGLFFGVDCWELLLGSLGLFCGVDCLREWVYFVGWIAGEGGFILWGGLLGIMGLFCCCLLYTSDAADDRPRV